jgi:iron-sulfur cluster repair protein YtfE (RIC family)
MAEHREIEAMLSELERLLETTPNPNSANSSCTEKLMVILRSITRMVSSHIIKEHEILFPALEAFFSPEEGPLDVLREEHASLQAQLLVLRKASELLAEEAEELPVQNEIRRVGRVLIRSCRDHMYKEDFILFPMVARLLPAERDQRLLQQMTAIKD